jgi:hypothetical protein
MAIIISTSRLANLLGQDPTFIGRVSSVLCDEATTVLAETGVGPTHAARAAYAQRVMQSPVFVAGQAAPFLAQSTNVVGTIGMDDSGVLTTVTDAALLSQIAASWNTLAGIDSGN